MEMYKVVLMELNMGAECTICIDVDEAETSENIFIRAKIKGNEITSSNYSYLTAYQECRDKLLEAGYGMKCNGSRINAVQSEMMSATDKVYLVEMGRKALSKDIARIWDYADIDIFPDTKQQNDFFEQWSSR